RDRGAAGDEKRARSLLASIERAQQLLGGGQTLGGVPVATGSGVVSASSPLDTGFGFGYYPYRHTGATAWYLLAATGTNPLRAQ
ncbi:MAG: Tat pathway signal sequence domain protein, partial [Streptomyces sp.]|nr:Tat pathway signal sequence domain protein [Streptomyces sp.]